MSKIIHWFTTNHVTANLIMIIIFILGGMKWLSIHKEVFPPTKLDSIIINVPYYGATAKEIEMGVVFPIENGITGVQNILEISSISSPNMATIIVKALPKTNLDSLMQKLKSKISLIQDIPKEAGKPIYKIPSIKAEFISLAVIADVDEMTLYNLAEKVRDDLLRLKEITNVEIVGTRDNEISVEISDKKLKELQISFDYLAKVIKSSYLDIPIGKIETSSYEILLRSKLKSKSISEIKNINIITRPNGAKIKLGDIANIKELLASNPIEIFFDGKKAQIINVIQTPNQNVIKASKVVKDFVKNKSPNLYPDIVEIKVFGDSSVLLNDMIYILLKNGIQGLILVYFILAIFLRPILGFYVALGIPISIAGTIAIMEYTNTTINIITLFAFILVVGIVVDDAIVVGENVFRRMRIGEPPVVAASHGTSEVAAVVTFGVLTTIVAFIPLLFVTGSLSSLIPNIPIIAIPVLIISLFESKTILPAHLSKIRIRG